MHELLSQTTLELTTLQLVWYRTRKSLTHLHIGNIIASKHHNNTNFSGAFLQSYSVISLSGLSDQSHHLSKRIIGPIPTRLATDKTNHLGYRLTLSSYPLDYSSFLHNVERRPENDYRAVLRARRWIPARHPLVCAIWRLPAVACRSHLRACSSAQLDLQPLCKPR